MKNCNHLFYVGLFLLMTNTSLMASNLKTSANSLFQAELVAVVPNSFIGQWDYTAADAPYEYRSGVLFITKEKEGYGVKVKLGYNTLKATEVVLEKNTMKFSIWVEGEKIEVSLEMKGDELIGEAISSQGPLALKGTRRSAK